MQSKLKIGDRVVNGVYLSLYEKYKSCIYLTTAISLILLVCLADMSHAETEFSGNIQSDMTLTQENSPYRVTAYVRVLDNVTLTIEPGVELRFNWNVGIDINGYLSAVGTAANPVIFTGSEETAGYWRAINIQNQGSARLEHCQVTYGGSLGNGIVKTGSGNLTMKNTTVANTGGISGIGLLISANTGEVLVEDSVFESNVEGLTLRDGGPVTVRGSLFKNNTRYGIILQAQDAPPTDPSNSFSGNELADIGVLRGSIPADLTWRPAGAPIRIVGYVTVDEGATLTIEPGTRVKLNGNVGLEINGHLSAVGTSGNPIVFTRGEEAVWRAINIQNQGSARLEHCQVTYGGSLGNGIVKTGSGNLTLKNTTVANTNGIGLIIQNSTGLHTVASNTFSANTIGVDVSNQENDLILTNNIIEDNENFGVRNQSAADIIIDARDNWWGHETGPFHAELNPGGQGDTISDGVLFDPWKTTPVEGTAAGTPSSIQVPPTSTTGSYTVSWGSSSTSGVTYVLEEATNSTFTSGRRTAYTGSNLSASITGRSDGIYYYRVKATKDGYEDSDWRTGSNGCTVNVESAEVTVNPVTSNTVSFGDIINVPEEITWVWLWTGNEVDGKYTGSLVNTSSFNIFGEGWIEVDDLYNLKLDFAQYDNTILYILPWSRGSSFDWVKFEVDFITSDQVKNSVNMNITQDTYASEVFRVENVQYGTHWLQLWIGDYLDTSEFNIYGNGWIEASDLSELVIPGDAFSDGDSLWVRQYSQSPGSSSWGDYGWLEFRIKGSGPSPGDTWTDPVTGMEFVWVPGGCFDRGCGDWDDECRTNELPVREICLDGFWMGKYEVTQGQWTQIMGSNPSRFQSGNNYPVEWVSWNDVQGFITELNARGSSTFRLPTEAEWEYAARSGGRAEKYAGGDDLDSLGWYSSNSGGLTHEVGTKAANGLGIYDMSGNVWEWVSDWYGANYYSVSPRDNPQGPETGSTRVFRGGSWFYPAWYCRAAIRRHWPGYWSYGIGFRLALSPGQQ